MKFINFFAPENHYFCVAVDSNQYCDIDIKYANVNMLKSTSSDGWQFNVRGAIGERGDHYSGKDYVTDGNYKNALISLNDLSKQQYTSIAQHFADMYL